jgi:hypothetical protein
MRLRKGEPPSLAGEPCIGAKRALEASLPSRTGVPVSWAKLLRPVTIAPLTTPNHRPEPANAGLLERHPRSRLASLNIGSLNKDSRSSQKPSRNNNFRGGPVQ